MDSDQHIRNRMAWCRIPIEERLISWAQNDEMVDKGYTQKGQDLLEAAEWIKWAKLNMPLDRHKKT